MIKIGNNIKLRTYKDLIAWQKSYKLCLDIFEATKLFPRSELFALTNQIKKSALSIPSNIAEGYTRQSTQDYLRFLNIAYSSLAELETQILLAKDLKYITKDTYTQIKQLHEEVQRIMYGLIKSLKYSQYSKHS